MNLPNKLTTLRVIMIPFFVFFLLWQNGENHTFRMIALALYALPAWMVIIIISREFIISGFRLIASDNGVVIAASYWGKFKTTFQMVSVVLLILDIPALAFVTTICVWIALLLTIVSLVDYIYKNHKILTEGSI